MLQRDTGLDDAWPAELADPLLRTEIGNPLLLRPKIWIY